MSDATIKIEAQGMFRDDWVELNPLATIGGFSTERDFTRHLCRQIAGMRMDLHNGDGETLLNRITSLNESAAHYLLLYGTGDTIDILGNGLDQKNS